MPTGSYRPPQMTHADRLYRAALCWEPSGPIVSRAPSRAHHVVRSDTGLEQPERALGVQIARVLGLHREDQLVQRIRGSGRPELPEVPLEPAGERPDAAAVDGHVTAVAWLRNCVRCGRKVSGTVSVGPLRCLATIRSARPFLAGSASSR